MMVQSEIISRKYFAFPQEKLSYHALDGITFG